MVKLLLLLVLLATTTLGALIETKHLDPDISMVIEVGNKTATSLLFPESLSSIAGFGLTTGEDPGTYHYTHDATNNLLLLRNVMPDKRCLMTVLMGKSLFVFELVPSQTPMIAVTLQRNPTPQAREVSKQAIFDRRLDHTPERLLNLMKLARHELVLSPMLPDTYKNMESREVEHRRDYGGVHTLIRRVSRFRNYDSFVFSGFVMNYGDADYQIDTSKLRLLVGNQLLPIAVIQLQDKIASGAVAEFQGVVVGNGHGSRQHLAVDNPFFLLLPPKGAETPTVVKAKPLSKK